MALDTYANLISTIINRSHVNTITQDLSDEFIDLTEQEFCYGVGPESTRLRVREMESNSQDVCSTTSRSLSLPSGLLQFTKVRIFPEITSVTNFSTNVLSYYPQDLTFVAPESLKITTATGVPQNFTISDNLLFDFVPASTYVVDMFYFSKPTALSDSNTSNSILTNYPSIYLNGCLYHLYEYIQEPTAATYHYKKFIESIMAANSSYSDSSLGPNPTITFEGCVP